MQTYTAAADDAAVSIRHGRPGSCAGLLLKGFTLQNVGVFCFGDRGGRERSGLESEGRLWGGEEGGHCSGEGSALSGVAQRRTRAIAP